MIESERPTSRDSAAASDRSLVLCSAAQLEYKLGEILHEFLLDSAVADRLIDGPLASLTARAQACQALALIDEHEFADCEAISRICGEFHRSPFASMDSERVTSICRKLHYRDKSAGGSGSTALDQFRSTLSTLLDRLANRGFYIGHEKRTRRSWQI